jgi:hypothetical protein
MKNYWLSRNSYKHIDNQGRINIMSDPTLVPCQPPGFINDLNIDTPPPYCRDQDYKQSSGTIDHQGILDGQSDVASRDVSWLEDATQNKMGQGASALCDPQQTGHIINEQGMSPPNRNTVYRYAKSVRGTDEACMDLFRDIIVLDESGKAHQIPIIWATQEKAVAYILQENTRKDQSLVVDRIRLPMLAIHASSYNFNQDRYTYHKAVDYLRDFKNNKPGFTTSERYQRDTVFGVTRGIPIDIGYTLYAWTLYEEDMNQILTQIVTKFSPMAYIRVRGISWEIGVKLDSIANNVNIEPGDKQVRVFKYQFSFTAESYVAQPIVRKKAVLKTRIEVADSTIDDDITEVLDRLEQAVKELEE